MTKPYPIRLNLSLPTASAQSFYSVWFTVTPSTCQHGSPYVVEIERVTGTDMSFAHTVCRDAKAALLAHCDELGRGEGWLTETLIDRYVASTTPKARRARKVAA